MYVTGTKANLYIRMICFVSVFFYPISEISFAKFPKNNLIEGRAVLDKILVKKKGMMYNMNNEGKIELTPKNDVIFKRLFGKKGNERLVKDFLEGVLDVEIESVELEKETQIIPEHIDEKLGILDVRATLSNGAVVDIELPKFVRSKKNMDRKLDQWLAFIEYTKKELVEVAKEKNSAINEAASEYEYLTGEAAAQRLAFLREKGEYDYNSGLEYAKNEGIEQGMKEGEKNKQLEIAKKMKEKNIPIDEIIEITGLPKEEIERL